MWKLMQSERFRVRFGKVATSPADVEAAATFSLLALAVKLYVKMRGVPPSFITTTELLLYLEGQRDDEKAALWKRVYRDGPDSARAREELEQAILGHEPTEVLREKLHAFVSTFPGRQDIAERPKCTGIAASWCPVCGDCACPRKGDGELVDEKRPADDCPLHGRASRHAEDNSDYALSERMVVAARRAVDNGVKPRCRSCGAPWGDTAASCVRVEFGAVIWKPSSEHEWSFEVPFVDDGRGV